MTAPIRQPVRLPTSARGQFPCATARSKTGRSCPRALLASLRQTEHGLDVIPDLPPGVQRSSSSCQPNHRGHVAVVSLRGELDFLGASVPQAYLSGIRWQAWVRSVADLTGLAFIDYASACLYGIARRSATRAAALPWPGRSPPCSGACPSLAC